MQKKDTLPIDSMEAKARQYQLNGISLFDILDIDVKIKAWNGVGPKYFPMWARRILSKLHYCILPAAYIHDLRFEIGGTRKDFKFANKEFLKNMKICLSMNKGRFTKFGILVEKMRIRLAYKLVCWFGWKSWNKKEAKYNFKNRGWGE